MASKDVHQSDDTVVLSASETAELSTLGAEFPGITSMDPNEVVKRMAGRMRKAENLDDLFDALSGSNSKSLAGKTFEFRNVTWQPYKAESGIIPLAVCEVVNVATGEEEEFVTTGSMMVEFLRRAQQLDLYPFIARIEEKLTRGNQKALNLVRA